MTEEQVKQVNEISRLATKVNRKTKNKAIFVWEGDPEVFDYLSLTIEEKKEGGSFFFKYTGLLMPLDKLIKQSSEHLKRLLKDG